MRVKTSHEYNTDADTFWDKIMFDPAYNRALYCEALQFPEWEVLEERDQGDAMTRRVRVVPRQDAPAAVQKLVGARFSYVEEGRYDKTRRRYAFRVVPGAMADKVRAEGELYLEPVGPKKVRRVVEMTIEVRVPLVGGLVESFVSKSMQDSYAAAAAFTNQWIVRAGL
jgi:hypothetical protein